MHNMKKSSDEVFFAPYPKTGLTWETVEALKLQVRNNASHKARICIHDSMSAGVHQMLIGLSDKVYVRPHKHRSKDESIHVIEGRARLVIFDETGRITEVMELGGTDPGRHFFTRLGPGIYHTLIVESEIFVFHETIAGPFNREDTVWAPWAPDIQDHENVSAFVAGLAACGSGSGVGRREA